VRDQHDFPCRSGDWAKVLGGSRVRDRSRREDSDGAHQEGNDEQKEVKRTTVVINRSGSGLGKVLIGLCGGRWVRACVRARPAHTAMKEVLYDLPGMQE
jgi:hypothetical protein